MAEFLTTHGTSYNIEKIIIEAQKYLFLVSPFLKLSKTFHERLKDASKRGVSIKIIYGKDELKPNERNSLADLKKLELYYFENLHAKCYFNENNMVITSMNMYEFSEKTNREMGVLIQRDLDRELYDNAVKETDSILRSAEEVPLRKEARQSYNKWEDDNTIGTKTISKKIIRGYCIRCQERVEYQPEKPLCFDCYMVWQMYRNYDYIENVCHRCGEFETVSMGKPQCDNCLDELRKDKKSFKNGF